MSLAVRPVSTNSGRSLVYRQELVRPPNLRKMPPWKPYRSLSLSMVFALSSLVYESYTSGAYSYATSGAYSYEPRSSYDSHTRLVRLYEPRIQVAVYEARSRASCLVLYNMRLVRTRIGGS